MKKTIETTNVTYNMYDDINEMYHTIIKMYVNTYENDYVTFVDVMKMFNDLCEKLMNNIIYYSNLKYNIFVDDEYNSYNIVFYDYANDTYIFVEYVLRDDDKYIKLRCNTTNTLHYNDINNLFDNEFDVRVYFNNYDYDVQFCNETNTYE